MSPIYRGITSVDPNVLHYLCSELKGIMLKQLTEQPDEGRDFVKL